MGLQEINWNRIIAENVKKKFVPLNQQALRMRVGFQYNIDNEKALSFGKVPFVLTQLSKKEL